MFYSVVGMVIIIHLKRDKMKIGILTFHSSINPGSVLQAYCVFKLLVESFPRSHVEIINLVPYNREIREWNFFSKSFPFIRKDNITQYLSIRRFVRKHLNLSKRRYYRNLNEQIKYINKQNYNLIFTGSDTIWMNSEKLDNALPSIYFLPKEITAKKVSIAASVDPLIDETPYMEKKKTLKELFDKFLFITVRDKMTYTLLEKIEIPQILQIADPTLLYNFESSLNYPIKKMFSRNNKMKTMIWVTDKIVSNRIKEILSNKYKTIELVISDTKGFGINYLTRVMHGYQDLDIVITDRFHRSIFALKLSSALVINIERESKNPIPISKGRDLFQSIGIPKYCVRFDSKSKDNFAEELVELIDNYDNNEFIKREEKLDSYINTNKKNWKDLIAKLKSSLSELQEN